MCWATPSFNSGSPFVSVAGCLGYDVLESISRESGHNWGVSVAGCLGYDVLVQSLLTTYISNRFSCWLFRL